MTLSWAALVTTLPNFRWEKRSEPIAAITIKSGAYYAQSVAKAQSVAACIQAIHRAFQAVKKDYFSNRIAAISSKCSPILAICYYMTRSLSGKIACLLFDQSPCQALNGNNNYKFWQLFFSLLPEHS